MTIPEKTNRYKNIKLQGTLVIDGTNFESSLFYKDIYNWKMGSGNQEKLEIVKGEIKCTI